MFSSTTSDWLTVGKCTFEFTDIKKRTACLIQLFLKLKKTLGT